MFFQQYCLHCINLFLSHYALFSKSGAKSCLKRTSNLNIYIYIYIYIYKFKLDMNYRLIGHPENVKIKLYYF